MQPGTALVTLEPQPAVLLHPRGFTCHATHAVHPVIISAVLLMLLMLLLHLLPLQSNECNVI